MTSFALAIPHAPWLTDRAENMNRLLGDLSPKEGPTLVTPDASSKKLVAEHPLHPLLKIFTAKGPWPERSVARWEWALSTGRDWFVQLEDDVLVAPSFWSALAAMASAWPTDILNLSATHSMAPTVVHQGRRSYFTPKMLGWAMAWPMTWTEKLLAWAKQGELAKFAARPGATEDAFLCEFFVHRGMTPRHPCPTIVDQLYFPSTRGSVADDATNMHASVTWRDFPAADMAAPEWWGTRATHLPPEWTKTVAAVFGRCGWCFERQAIMQSEKTGVGLCKSCIIGLSLQVMGVPVPGTQAIGT